MLEQPRVDLVDDLHWLGRRLAVLKRLYGSYQLVISRILQRQHLLRDEARSHREISHNIRSFSEVDIHNTSFSAERSFYGGRNISDPAVGVTLSSLAVGRFERLADRIELYCLREIETCLTEKESLTVMVGNCV